MRSAHAVVKPVRIMPTITCVCHPQRISFRQICFEQSDETAACRGLQCNFAYSLPTDVLHSIKHRFSNIIPFTCMNFCMCTNLLLNNEAQATDTHWTSSC